MTTSDYQRALGERLRAIRTQQGLTLYDVEERSGGTWKAVVVGAYERGDRAVSITRLAELADFYGVPLGVLLPAPATAGDAARDDQERDEQGRGDQDRDDRVVLDLTRLTTTEGDSEPLTAVQRFAQRIQLQRGDYNGRALTLRRTDVRALSVILDTDPEGLTVELADRGLLLQP